MMLVTSTSFLRKVVVASMTGCSVKYLSGYTPKNSWGRFGQNTMFSLFCVLSIFKLVMNNQSSNLSVLELTEGPDCSYMPTGTSTVRQTLHDVLHIHLALLCGRRLPHGGRTVGDPGKPVKLEHRTGTQVSANRY